MIQVIINVIRGLGKVGMKEFQVQSEWDDQLNVINFAFTNE